MMNGKLHKHNVTSIFTWLPTIYTKTPKKKGACDIVGTNFLIIFEQFKPTSNILSGVVRFFYYLFMSFLIVLFGP